MTEVGDLVGRGRTSDVYAYGSDSVVKIAHDEVPEDWPAFEAELTNAVWNLGVAAPEVRDVIAVNGRPSVVFERIPGPSMWQQMIDDPSQVPALGRELASIQKALLQIGIPPGVPDLIDRLARKLRVAPGLTSAERSEAESLAVSLPRGAALLHGDLHPGNVLMGANGPVVIDWFDATVGHPIADVVRSSILIQPGRQTAPRHLPGATAALLDVAQTAYLEEFRGELQVGRSDLATWLGVVAAGRLSEDAEHDVGALMELWSARADHAEAAKRLLS